MQVTTIDKKGLRMTWVPFNMSMKSLLLSLLLWMGIPLFLQAQETTYSQSSF